MSDPGQVCCILGVCCPPGSPAQREALAKALEGVESPADYMLEHFDLAPKGTLDAFKAAIATMNKAKR